MNTAQLHTLFEIYANTRKKQELQKVITSRVCGRGNVFVVSVCVCVSVRSITFEVVDTETSFLVW